MFCPYVAKEIDAVNNQKQKLCVSNSSEFLHPFKPKPLALIFLCGNLLSIKKLQELLRKLTKKVFLEKRVVCMTSYTFPSCILLFKRSLQGFLVA